MSKPTKQQQEGWKSLFSHQLDNLFGIACAFIVMGVDKETFLDMVEHMYDHALRWQARAEEEEEQGEHE